MITSDLLWLCVLYSGLSFVALVAIALLSGNDSLFSISSAAGSQLIHVICCDWTILGIVLAEIMFEVVNTALASIVVEFSGLFCQFILCTSVSISDAVFGH